MADPIPVPAPASIDPLRQEIERILSPAIDVRAPYAKQMVDRLQSLVGTAPPEPQWQPIETYPEGRPYVLLASSAHGRVIGAHVTGDCWHLVGVGVVTNESERPNHWMPLPDPPAAGRVRSRAPQPEQEK